MAEPLLELRAVTKHYGAVAALTDASLSCRGGSIHAIMGENGAGKSTLIKVVSGVVQPSSGSVLVDGEAVRLEGPAAAQARGIVCVFQELSLLPDLSVADNICIAQPPRRFGMIDARAQRREAERLLAVVGCEGIDPRARVRDLSLSRQQMVEIAKALGRSPRLLILDEATSALTADDVATVSRLIRGLRDQGLCVLYISHRMHEIRELADTCSVFANGRHVESFAAGARSEAEIVRMMIGREITQVFPPRRAPAAAPPMPGPPVLETRALSWAPRLDRISMSLRAGEIVGLGGLDGQGQREFLLALFGGLAGVEGEVLVDGVAVRPSGPAAAKAYSPGLALIPEDRKTEGLMLSLSVRDNLAMATLDRRRRGPLIDAGAERLAVEEIVRRMRIKAQVALPVSTLSGGNQQKVVIGKWLMAGPRVLLLSDPTRGIDVGTKQEIYRLLRELADAGAAVLFTTTDYDELIGLCDRVLILYAGRVVREMAAGAITEEAIISASLGLHGETAAAA
ncbi:MAG: sugar ABC transporter ATP-binding protein [Janthinobacterium lividum]